jgi:hypothetical protein
MHPQAKHAAEHLSYELRELNAAVRQLEAVTPPTGSEYNRCVESVLTHARNLMDFLGDRKKFASDVWAGDYLDTPNDWVPDMGAAFPYLLRQRERLNRSIQHVTYDRIAYEADKSWDFTSLAAELNQAWHAFLHALLPDRREWFAGQTPGTYQAPHLPSVKLTGSTASPSLTDVRTF